MAPQHGRLCHRREKHALEHDVKPNDLVDFVADVILLRLVGRQCVVSEVLNFLLPVLKRNP